jgi:hypothetical protein
MAQRACVHWPVGPPLLLRLLAHHTPRTAVTRFVAIALPAVCQPPSSAGGAGAAGCSASISPCSDTRSTATHLQLQGPARCFASVRLGGALLANTQQHSSRGKRAAGGRRQARAAGVRRPL